jgi:hypothetical protein
MMTSHAICKGIAMAIKLISSKDLKTIHWSQSYDFKFYNYSASVVIG